MKGYRLLDISNSSFVHIFPPLNFTIFKNYESKLYECIEALRKSSAFSTNI